MPARAPRLLSRARAAAVARRLALDALRGLAWGVDRLSDALQSPPRPLPLRGSPGGQPHVEPHPTTADRADPRPTPPVERQRGQDHRADPIPASAVEPMAPRVELPSVPGDGSRPDTDPPATALEPAALALSPGLAQVTHLRQRLDPQIAALRTHLDWEQAQDPVEALRQLRVATRRLRAFTRLFAPTLGAKRAKRVRRRLRTITRGIGPLREWDVTLAHLHAVHQTAPPLGRAAFEHVIAWAQARRTKTIGKARQVLANPDVARLADDLESDLDRICGRILRRQDTLAQDVWAMLAPVLDGVFGDLPQQREESDVEPLHEIRARAKRLRYALELLRPALGEAYRPLRRPAKRLQRSLGTHHDHALMAALLNEHAEQLRAQGLQTLAAALDPHVTALLELRRAAHQEALPHLAVLSHGRYVAIAREQLGVGPAPVDGPSPPDADATSEVSTSDARLLAPQPPDDTPYVETPDNTSNGSAEDPAD